MTRAQKLAWLNITLFVPFLALVVLEQAGVTFSELPMVLLCLAVVVVTFALARQKGVSADERDGLYGRRAIMVAYLALTICLGAGVIAAGFAFPQTSIPLRFLYFLSGGSWMVSMLAMSIATLLQYRKG
jgi:hypothetical protein